MKKFLLGAGILIGMGVAMTIIAAAHAIGAGLVVLAVGVFLLSRTWGEPEKITRVEREIIEVPEGSREPKGK